MIKKGILCFTMIFIFGTWVWAESPVWKVQKDQSVIYLGSTFHILREKDFPLPPAFDQAYKLSSMIVFETDIGKFQALEIQQKLLARAIYMDGSTIDKHLSSQAYEMLNTYCNSNKIPLETLKKLKPSVLMVTLTVMEIMKQGGTQQGVDLFYYNQASRDKKIVEGLESIDEQIDFITSMADGLEDDFVIQSLNELKTIKQNFETLVNAWRKGDTEKLNELMVSELKTKLPKLYQKINTDRNNRWLPLIEGYLKTPPTEFILVGAGHLVGSDGIIEALKKKGYKVENL